VCRCVRVDLAASWGSFLGIYMWSCWGSRDASLRWKPWRRPLLVSIRIKLEWLAKGDANNTTLCVTAQCALVFPRSWRLFQIKFFEQQQPISDLNFI
jgi:hypothetical protein